MKRILIACEYSGMVRDAFSAKGFDAWSADLLPSETQGNHYQGSVLDILGENWDMLIAFPPCTYLTYAGMANWYDEGRAMKRIKAAEFFMQLYDSPIKRICIENPQGIMSKIFREPDQVIHPYYFGERQMKRTCLWLKNLPKLNYQLNADLFGNEVTASERPEPSKIEITEKRVKKRYFTDEKIKSGHSRSKTFQAVADAMAAQWSVLF